jgi:MoxR-like ATPase
VIATQNPVEQAGTFELPEAQLDRFLLRHKLTYPDTDQELEVLRRNLSLGLKRTGKGAVPMSAFDAISSDAPLGLEDLSEAMGQVQGVHVSEVFLRHTVELVQATRTAEEFELGASPRAGLALTTAARARAWIHGRDYVVPEDLFDLAQDVLLHRTRLTYEALARGMTNEHVLTGLLDRLV